CLSFPNVHLFSEVAQTDESGCPTYVAAIQSGVVASLCRRTPQDGSLLGGKRRATPLYCWRAGFREMLADLSRFVVVGAVREVFDLGPWRWRVGNVTFMVS